MERLYSNTKCVQHRPTLSNRSTHTHPPPQQPSLQAEVDKCDYSVVVLLCQSMSILVTERKIYRGTGTKAKNQPTSAWAVRVETEHNWAIWSPCAKMTNKSNLKFPSNLWQSYQNEHIRP